MKNKIQETEKRLHFTIVLSLFFPVLIEALFNSNNSSSEVISEAVLKSGVVIFILIVNYLLFEWRKKFLTLRQLTYLNWVFVSTIFCYALVILFFGLVASGNIISVNWFVQLYYPTALVGAMYLPAVSIALMTFSFIRMK